MITISQFEKKSEEKDQMHLTLEVVSGLIDFNKLLGNLESAGSNISTFKFAKGIGQVSVVGKRKDIAQFLFENKDKINLGENKSE